MQGAMRNAQKSVRVGQILVTTNFEIVYYGHKKSHWLAKSGSSGAYLLWFNPVRT